MCIGVIIHGRAQLCWIQDFAHNISLRATRVGQNAFEGPGILCNFLQPVRTIAHGLRHLVQPARRIAFGVRFVRCRKSRSGEQA